MAIEQRDGGTVWVRVNVYDRLADFCKDILKESIGLCVRGELMERMNRVKEERVLEIRGRRIIVIDRERKQVYGRDSNGGDRQLESSGF